MEFTPIFFSGGKCCIDFCNTFDHFHSPPAYDFIPDFTSALQWGGAADILPPSLQGISNFNKRDFKRLLEARSLIFDILAPFSKDSHPSAADLAAFDHFLQETSSQMGIVPGKDGYSLACLAADPLIRILCEVVHSTAELLLSNQPKRVKQCKECGWLFYDSTRNLSRRWCDMQTCGNKAKARRHYKRVKDKKQFTSL
jgi:predicted RNA-binding Zn ribbon-like protein